MKRLIVCFALAGCLIACGCQSDKPIASNLPPASSAFSEASTTSTSSKDGVQLIWDLNQLGQYVQSFPPLPITFVGGYGLGESAFLYPQGTGQRVDWPVIDPYAFMVADDRLFFLSGEDAQLCQCDRDFTNVQELPVPLRTMCMPILWNEKIMYTGFGGESLYVYSPDTKKVDVLNAAFSGQLWFVQNDKLYFNNDSDAGRLYLLDLKTMTERRLMEDTSATLGCLVDNVLYIYSHDPYEGPRGKLIRYDVQSNVCTTLVNNSCVGVHSDEIGNIYWVWSVIT